MVAGDRVWRAVISGVSGDAVRFALVSEVEAEPALPVTLLLSVFKFDRMEWIIEKATELGAERFIPMTARRSEKHLVQAAPARLERWRRVAREAAKQSRRSDVPVVEDVVLLKQAVSIQAAHPGLSLLLAGTRANDHLVLGHAGSTAATHHGETGSEPRRGTGGRVDSGGRSSLRSRRMAGGKSGSANPAGRDGGDYGDGGDCCDAWVKCGRVSLTATCQSWLREDPREATMVPPRYARPKNNSKRSLLNRRSLGFARDDKGEGDPSHRHRLSVEPTAGPSTTHPGLVLRGRKSG
jgi:hypothetical protein